MFDLSVRLTIYFYDSNHLVDSYHDFQIMVNDQFMEMLLTFLTILTLCLLMLYRTRMINGAINPIRAKKYPHHFIFFMSGNLAKQHEDKLLVSNSSSILISMLVFQFICFLFYDLYFLNYLLNVAES